MKRHGIGALAFIAIAGVLGFTAMPHQAGAQQSQLATNSNSANFGVHALRAGFTPDPKVINVRSGGSINASSIGLPSGCNGYVTRQPDAVINYTGRPATSLLRLYVLAAGDTTLVVNDGAGNWHCNDDSSGGRNPQVDIANPPAGHYDIWVGSYQSGQQIAGTLNITELTSNGTGSGGGTATPTGPAAGSQGTRACGTTQRGRPACVDANAASPNFGCRGRGRVCNVRTGFTPDPWVFPLSAGGGRDPINVQSLGLHDSSDNSACSRSFITPRPDFRFVFQAGNSFPMLRMYVQTLNGADATLLVNTPDGRWRCNDDSWGGRMPTIDFTNPPPGRYDVWVGTYDASARNPARFNVTELQSNHP